MAKHLLTTITHFFSRPNIRNSVTGILLILSVTVNAYLLLQIRVKPLPIRNSISLEQKNAAFLQRQGVVAIVNKRSNERIVEIANDIQQVDTVVDFEIKKGKLDEPDKINEPPKQNPPAKQNPPKKQKSPPKQKTQCNVYCADTSKWTQHIVNPKTDTNLLDWTFKKKRKCPAFSVDEYPKVRSKVSLQCEGKSSKLVMTSANSTRDIQEVEFGNKCLQDVINNCCHGKYVVPNVVHYIWYADKELGYFQFVSFMSALRFMKPCLILIHGSYIPRGKYWDYFVSISPNIIHVKRERPTEIFGQKLAYPEHASDIMRIEALIAYGGVYLDFDEILLRNVESLRKYDYTQGHERDVTLGSQFVMARRNATFLNYWYHSYRDDYQKTWAWNALWVPEKLSKKYPNLIHVEGYNFTRPNWQHVDLIYNANYDWSTNYGMHMYVRWYKNVTNNVIIRKLNTTIGAVCRHVLFGNKELCVR